MNGHLGETFAGVALLVAVVLALVLFTQHQSGRADHALVDDYCSLTAADAASDGPRYHACVDHVTAAQIRTMSTPAAEEARNLENFRDAEGIQP